MKSLQLFNTLTGEPEPDAHPGLLKIALLKRKEDEIFHKLEKLNIQTVNSPVDWKSCINVSLKSDEVDAKIAMAVLASKMAHDDRMPIEIARMNNEGIDTIWVKTL